MLTGCGSGKNEVYLDTTPKGYMQHTEVSGVSFAIPSTFTDSATAISEVSENGDFKSDVTYEFKNGQDTYLLFNMESLVIIVRKGTDFGFVDTDDKTQCLKQSSILSVQLDLPQRAKKIEYTEQQENGVYKFIGTVKAEAVITRNVYGDFIGKVSSICVGNDEWTMFVGVPGTRYTRVDKKQKEVIETIAKSLSPLKDDSAETAQTATTGETDSSESASTTRIIKGGKTTSVIDNKGNLVTGTDGESEAAGEESAVTKEEEKENAGAAGSPDLPQETPDTSSAEAGEQETEETADESKGINMSNQKEAEQDGDSFQSDIYSMLAIGQKGDAQVLSDEAGEIIPVAVTLNTVTTGQQAIDTIKEFCASGASGEAYQDPPVGTSWVVATYDVDYKGNTERPSVNSKLYGLNGKKLYLNGIGYSTRTYDMNYKATDGRNLMIYYALPINCKEYVLAFGDGNVDNLYRAAYYHISEDNSNGGKPSTTRD